MNAESTTLVIVDSGDTAVDRAALGRLGGSAVTNLDDFDSALRKHKGGDAVPVVVVRGGVEVTLEVTLDPPR